MADIHKITVVEAAEGMFPSFNVVLERRSNGGGVLWWEGLVVRAFSWHHEAPDRRNERLEWANEFALALGNLLGFPHAVTTFSEDDE